MPTVYFSAPVRKFTEGVAEGIFEGPRLSEVLAAVERRHPAFQTIREPSGLLEPGILIFVDSVAVHTDVEIRPSSEIELLTIAYGG